MYQCDAFPKAEIKDQKIGETPSHSQAQKLLGQVRRLESLVSTLKSNENQPKETKQNKAQQIWQAFQDNLSEQDVWPINQPHPQQTTFSCTIAFRLLTARYLKHLRDHYSKLLQVHKAERQQLHKQALIDPPHSIAAYRYIKNGHCSKLFCLKTDDGSYVTSPDKMDKTLIDAWKPIYAGNNEGSHQAAADYMLKYNRYLHKAAQVNIPAWTVEQLMETCSTMAATATGLDGFHPHDFKVLPHESLKWIVTLLALVEDGASWPAATLKVGAHLLNKDQIYHSHLNLHRLLLWI